MIDWNDLKYLLAVAEGGSTLAAGRALRVSQTTVARRIAALEQAVGYPLFEKRQAGYALTASGEALIAKAQSVRSAALAFEEAAAAIQRGTAGTVRVTTIDLFANTFLAQWLVDLHERHPDVRIELDESGAVRDLGAGDADIAIRSTSSEAAAGVVGRRICRDEWTFYCSRTYADRHGVPRKREELRGHALIGGGGTMTWQVYEAILRDIGIADQVVIQQTTMGGLLTGIRSGLGIGVLPCLIGDGEEDLIRCMPPRREKKRWVWLLTHERVRHSPSVRTVVDFLYERLAARVRQLGLD
ncbi:LysR family transcriptional regulator [Sphingomonas sp. HDW15A]|nr:LysR family transcriptional regulator [Sphingomonas sp. HDW15A]